MEIKEVYNTIAQEFSKTRFSQWKCVRNFIQMMPPSILVADVGCGNGKNLIIRDDIRFIACDISSELVSIASNKASTSDFVLSSCVYLPFRNDMFDYAICIAVLHHVKETSRVCALNEILRTLKIGGRLLFTVWAREQILKPKWVAIGDGNFLIPWRNTINRLYHLFTKDEVIDLVKNLDIACKVIHYDFECNNHCIILEKLNCKYSNAKTTNIC